MFKTQHLDLQYRKSEWKHDILKVIGNGCPLLTTLIISSLVTNTLASFDHFARLWVQGQSYLQHIEFDTSRGLSDDPFLPIAQYCHQLKSVELRLPV
ncbi:hypothetical protein RhiirA5_440022 [Rhizophagus irregularis]|uniref:Uncharacterized protein n=1 Tax=Rhizophagus irregularis TaxID=588596 RepID=A0A2N0NH47_9GLOM|nr:hypothetical protein RhiirA5_440022 [Rhizophagus irregularis]